MSKDQVLVERIERLGERLTTEFGDIKRRLDLIERGLPLLEVLARVEAHKDKPGVTTKAKQARESLEHLSRGDVVLQWRPEVYEHDCELIDAMGAGEVFRAVVPPLKDDSFDDIEFLEFIEAQKTAAKDRRVTVQRIYIFRNHEELRQKTSEGTPSKAHLDELVDHSRYIEVFTAVSPERYRSDMVLFGDERCSVSRGAVNTSKYSRFDVMYTSRQDKRDECKANWRRLMKLAKRY